MLIIVDFGQSMDLLWILGPGFISVASKADNDTRQRAPKANPTYFRLVCVCKHLSLAVSAAKKKRHRSGAILK